MSATPIDTLIEQIPPHIISAIISLWPAQPVTPEYLGVYETLLKEIEKKCVHGNGAFVASLEQRRLQLEDWIKEERKAIQQLRAINFAGAGTIPTSKGAG